MCAFRLVIYKSDSEGGHANVAFVYIRRITFATWTSKSELRMRNSHVKLVETWHKTIIQYILQLNVWICTFVQHTQKMVALQHCSFFSPSLFFFSLARTHFCSTNRNFSLASPTIKHWESIFVYGNNGRVRWLCEGALKRNKEQGLQWTHFSSLSHCTFHPDSISKRPNKARIDEKKEETHTHIYSSHRNIVVYILPQERQYESHCFSNSIFFSSFAVDVVAFPVVLFVIQQFFSLTSSLSVSLSSLLHLFSLQLFIVCASLLLLVVCVCVFVCIRFVSRM